MTGCFTPCLAVYKPTYFGVTVPPVFADQQQARDYWLEREYLVRAVFCGIIREEEYREKASSLQKSFFEEEKALRQKASKEELATFALDASKREKALVDSYREIILRVKENPSLLGGVWQKRTASLGKDTRLK